MKTQSPFQNPILTAWDLLRVPTVKSVADAHELLIEEYRRTNNFELARIANLMTLPGQIPAASEALVELLGEQHVALAAYRENPPADEPIGSCVRFTNNKSAPEPDLAVAVLGIA